MKLRLKLAERVFEVEVGDLGERPIVATVDGQRFEVWPEERKASRPLPEAEAVSEPGSPPAPSPGGPRAAQTAPEGAAMSAERRQRRETASGGSMATAVQKGTGTRPAIFGRGQRPLSQAARTVQAPIPGVIHSVSVKVGDVVTAGQTLCVLEAMKMRNVIGAPHGGEIAAVHIEPGQQVAHYETLVEFVE